MVFFVCDMAQTIHLDSVSFKLRGCAVCRYASTVLLYIQKVHSLSRHFAVKTFVRNLDALVLYCREQVNECNDPICSYILRLIRDLEYLLAVYTVNDVLDELANLSQFVQRSTLSPIEAHKFCVSKIRKLEAQYLGDNTFWNDKAKQILSENKAKLHGLSDQCVII